MTRKLRGLYAIADTAYLDDAHLAGAVEQAIAGGARVVQYRDKKNDIVTRRRQANALSRLCRDGGVIFLVNDDVTLARESGADGVHLGREDMSLEGARTQLGADRLIGVSCYNELEHAVRAEKQGADYVAFGSFFPSRTKPQAVRAGLDLLRSARAQLKIAVVAIGGITPENGAELIRAGADMLAVIEGVFGQPDVRVAARRYAELFRQD
ncbi:MAG: thiamine phosphate synthase [Gammaproteobacteria bacterium]|nr:MAG: thiamine phosphate synthase [Gammaproteobacteria bacterium]